MERIDPPNAFEPCAYEKKVIAKRLRDEQTPAERVLWQKLRANRLANLHFRRQHVICGFIVDFYCRPLSLVVEVDGLVHNEQKEYDRERDAILTAAGMTVIRFTNDQVLNDMRTVLSQVQTSAERLRTRTEE
jgi:very-short-patch-repair endonuclease